MGASTPTDPAEDLTVTEIVGGVAVGSPDGNIPVGYGAENALATDGSYRQYGDTGGEVYWEVAYNNTRDIESIIIQPDPNANVAFEDVHVELYDWRGRLIAVHYIDGLDGLDITIDTFYAPDPEGNITNRVFEAITACRVRIVRRQLSPVNNGIALKRVLVYGRGTSLTSAHDNVVRALSHRIIDGRVLGPYDPYTGVGEYWEELCVCNPLGAYNLVEPALVQGVNDNLSTINVG